MFIDTLRISIASGKGGDGMVHLKSIKSNPKAGPDGGNGGGGGGVYVYVDHNIRSLAHLAYKKKYKAADGQGGQIDNRAGKKGDDLILKLPVGTVIKDEEGTILYDLNIPGQLYKILDGGRGGYGNAHFTSSTRQTPRFAELGEPGKEIFLQVELKLLADVAIVGIPSVGKSTFISVISNAKPKIADYPFTTLVPNLGVVNVGKGGFICADIPGLIEDAHLGKGLGTKFLRHIERCNVVLHLLSSDSEDVLKDFEIVEKELQKYDEAVYSKPRVVAISKMDVVGFDKVNIKGLESLNKQVDKLFFISAATHYGIEELVNYLADEVSKYNINNIGVDKSDKIWEELSVDAKELNIDVDTLQGIPIYKPDTHNTDTKNYTLIKEDNSWIVDGYRINQIAIMTNEENLEAMQRLYDVLGKIGVIKKIKAKGFSADDIIIVADKEIPITSIPELLDI